jgi:hypothetical protein
VHPDRRDRTAFRASPPTDLRTAHVDFLLRFIIDRNAIASSSVSARLDALERTLAELTKQWRSDVPISPARELRMSGDTLASLLAWLEGADVVEPEVVARLGVYASGAVTDPAVPSDWLRVRFD